MKMTVRRCLQCGRLDSRRLWPSTDEAADDRALQGWVCPTCAWPEAELIEIEAIRADAFDDPLGPIEPDEARHAVAGPRSGA